MNGATVSSFDSTICVLEGLLENTHPGETHLDFEDGDGRPSRWNTLRALRVLEWYDATR